MTSINRATSAYTLRVYTEHQDLFEVVDHLMASLTKETPATDQHIDPGAGYASVSFRARGDEEATQLAARVLTSQGGTPPGGATLTTGLGVHRRTVTTWGVEEAQVCEWFALCDRPATGTLHHPILGDVPICDRCRAKAEQ